MALMRLFATAAVLAVCLRVVLAAPPAQAQTYIVLYSFAGGTDGANPRGGVIQDSKGNLYGTTLNGGASGLGTVFKLSRTGEETVLYSFKGGTDGQGPVAVIEDAHGNLYGTTYAGGATNGGTVFKVSKSGKETVLYSFCSQTNCTDGSGPNAGLIQDAHGNLYGTTNAGGATNGGTVFRLGKASKETVLYSFTGYSDGGNPFAGVIRDTEGNLYGTTYGGGAANGGTVFKLSKSGRETVLYSFCSQTYCRDGLNPIAGLIRDFKGNFYGTTYEGGDPVCLYGCGVVFKLSKIGRETVLHSFTGGADGGDPFESGVIENANGSLFGTTMVGGAADYGTVFNLNKAEKETVLYSFCSRSECSDGASPNSGVIQDAKGNLYGTTYYGGDVSCGGHGLGCGVVFKLRP